ncbi:MAG: serine acetyltransferase [Bacteroidales bacterium]|nr:serine acetyltransferase [Bacteroidales bacterium]
MTAKERLLEWIIRPERFYVCRYLRFLRKEEKYTFSNPNKFMAYWYKARKNRLGSRLGFIISAGCFDEGLVIEHYGSVIVNPKSRIGRNCKIHGNCCIGSNGGYPDDSPVIGDNVDIGQGAQILGGIRIADNVKIGAGAVVVKDVSIPGTTVVGIPARPVNQKEN